MTYEVSVTSLVKLLFHSIKYGSYTINGLLLGTVAGEVVQVLDAIPMYHTHISLSGQTEMALELVSGYCQEMKDKGQELQIVGYYEAQAQYGNSELSYFGKTIADKLTSQLKQPLVLLVNSQLLGSLVSGKGKDVPLDVYSVQGSTWRKAQRNATGVTWPATDLAGVVRDSMEAGTHLMLADMDEHLDDVSRNFLNPDLMKKVVGVQT